MIKDIIMQLPEKPNDSVTNQIPQAKQSILPEIWQGNYQKTNGDVDFPFRGSAFQCRQ
jgi:hypothetical protein